MAAAPSSLGDQICEELSCSICLELFTRPKVLPCQHTFCQDCLQDHAGKGGAFQCPNCRLKFKLPPQGVAGLPNNHLVTSLCERLQNQASLSGETREQPQSGNWCSFHPSEEVKLYCKQCNVPVCNECLDEMHSDHETISLKKALRERKAPIEVLITEGRKILEVYCGFLKSLREKEKTSDEQKQETDNSIIQAYNLEVQRAAEKRDHLLLQEEEKYKNNKEARKEERGRMLADVSKLSAACNLTEQEMEQGGVKALSLETVLAELVEKYRGKLQNAAPEHPQPDAQDVQPQSVHAVFQPPSTPVLSMVTVAGILVVAFAVLLYSPLYRQTVQPLSKTITFGGKGSGTGQLRLPFGVAVSDEGEIFVADNLNQRIQVFTLQGTFVRQFPTVVSGEERMHPHDVALDGEGNLWVVGEQWVVGTDLEFEPEFAVHVQYNKQGRLLRKFKLQKAAAGWLRSRGVAVDTWWNHILITQITEDQDNKHGEVLVFRPDGTLVRTVGQQQGMKYPWYVTVDGEGRILVSDRENHCVYVYNENGQFLFQFGGWGSGEGQLKLPHGICTDRAGNIIVADYGNNRVEMFDKAGRFLKHITTENILLHIVKVVLMLDLKPLGPWGVAIGPQGQLVVTDVSENTTHIIQSY
ncbi:tripartite motif-containing protein 2-like [Branchiostoma floridae x Branchiostoma japonicum]